MGGTGMAVVADIGRASEGNGAVLRPNILLNRHTHPAHPGSGRLVSSPSWAPACKLQCSTTPGEKATGSSSSAGPVAAAPRRGFGFKNNEILKYRYFVHWGWPAQEGRTSIRSVCLPESLLLAEARASSVGPYRV